MMIFHRIGASIICLALFFPMIWWGMLKLVFWHWPRVLIWRKRDSIRFVYHYTKSLDQSASAGMFDGKCDETVSNKAGQIFLLYQWASPWWVLFAKKLTERWETNHIETSIEPVRPDPKELHY